MSSISPSRNRLPYVVALVWLIATVSLASWWLVVGLSLTSQINELGASTLTTDFHRMFIWEGAVFIALLVAGGIAIVWAIRREHQRRHALETFFMSFTHDLKTALARIQLQAEGLREDWPDTAPAEPLDRLLTDAVRLQIQLENSLFVAQPDGRLLRERVNIAAAVRRLAEDWPHLEVVVNGDADLLVDARAFDAVVRNLLQNAVIHGEATRVDVHVSSKNGLARLTFVDNGRGVPADAFAQLGQPFVRPASTSGTGVGLFVCRQLVARLDGALRFVRPTVEGQGLVVELELAGAR